MCAECKGIGCPICGHPVEGAAPAAECKCLATKMFTYTLTVGVDLNGTNPEEIMRNLECLGRRAEEEALITSCSSAELVFWTGEAKFGEVLTDCTHQ